MAKNEQIEQLRDDTIVRGRQDRIIHLAKKASAYAGQTRKRARASIQAAIDCGKLLLEEKAMIEEKYQRTRGFWVQYFDTTFARHLDIRTGQRWMNLARHVIEGKIPEENIMRIGVLSLGMMPSKIHPDLAGDHHIGRIQSHLFFVNRFDVWRRSFQEGHAPGALTDGERQQLKADFRPVIDFFLAFGLIDGINAIDKPQ
jgi:hypothetical protein